MKLTVSNLKNILPGPRERIVWDDDVPGFGIRVQPSGVMSYIVQYRLKGQKASIRVTLGKAAVLRPDEAREMARRHLAAARDGRNLAAERIAAGTKNRSAVTLRQALEGYLAARKSMKASTRASYRYTAKRYLDSWMDRPLAAISKADVAAQHTAIAAAVAKRQADREQRRKQTQSSTAQPTKIAVWNGNYVSNYALKIFRAAYNYARELDERLPDNPVGMLSRTRAWFPETRRNRVIPANQLRPWHEAVMALENEVARDYLLTVLLTGLRRREAARLGWADVNLETRALLVPETKNGHPLALPVSVHLGAILASRKMRAGDSTWVFPAASKSGHIEEPKDAIARVAAMSGVRFSTHDLRRTFTTIAESLDISPYTLKALINHERPQETAAGADVTAGYIVLSVERLRDALEKITARILELIEQPVDAATRIVPLQTAMAS